MTMNMDLQDLVNTPKETLEVEYKQWLDLSDSINRANFARHIAAIANHGGGYIVLGFKNDMTPDPGAPDNLDGYTHDVISGIVKKYLTPTFHCDVFTVGSTLSGNTHPIVRIPSHGNVPICSVRSGPDDRNNKPQGIVQSVYYIRDVGPESTPAIGAAHWQPIIKRCVLADREALLKSLTQVLAGQTPGSVQASSEPSLKDWDRACGKYFLNHIISYTSGKEWPRPINTTHFQWSYRIMHDETALPKLNELLDLIHQTNSEVKGQVYDGWSMFYPFRGEGDEPAVFSEYIKDVEFDGYQVNLLRKDMLRVGIPDFWRITRSGWATLIRPYFEDRHTERKSNDYLDPTMLAKDVTEILLHAATLAKYFPSALSVEFSFQWVGLENRTLDSIARRRFLWTGRTSKVNLRKFHATYAVPKIHASLPGLVAEIANSVLKVFGGFEYSVEEIEKLIPTFHLQ